MISSKNEYEDIVIKLLNLIISGKQPSSKDFPECSDKDFREILYQCVEDKLILGYSMCRTADGNPAGQSVGVPYVTIKGLSFIDSVSQARALDIAKAAEAQSISAVLKSNKSFILSGISIAIAVLTNLDKIVANIRKLLSYLSSL